MNRVYFEKGGFKSFHQAYKEKRELQRKFGIVCKIDEHENKTATLRVTSIYEESQNILRNCNFKEIKVESI